MAAPVETPRPPALTPKLEPSWKAVLEQEFGEQYMHDLKAFLLEEKRGGQQVFPAGPDIFCAFELTPFEQVRVVIVGQDPYHGPGQAHGLSFSVPRGVRVPPSLANMYTELEQSIPGFARPAHGNLEHWARQGVLLLNATLTVRAHAAGSHQRQGWEQFTSAAIDALNERREGLVFLLWGRHAKEKAANVDRRRHHVLTAPHPSPLSASKGFCGCGHFAKVNELLVARGEAPIDWSLPD
jgi:uracil-DNA glycosylase